MPPRPSSKPAAIRVLLLGLLAGAALPSAVVAQVEATPVLDGRVRLGEVAGGGTPRDVGASTVVLHRVAEDTAGAVDSVRVAPDGAFTFSLPTVPDPGGRGDIYFASVEHQGILYFGDAVTTAVQLDSLYVIEVHDTTAAPPTGARLDVAIRYIVLEEGGASDGTPGGPDAGWRVTDLIQPRNDGARTLVTAGETPVWTYPLPAEALRAQVGAGDTGPDAVRVEDGRLIVHAPIPPGQRQFIVRYELTSPEVTFTLPGRTEAVEILIREPAPPLRVEGLEAGEPVDMGTGTTYRRYAGVEIRDGAIVVAPGEERSGLEVSPRWIAVILALLLGGVGVWAAVGRPGHGGAHRGTDGAGTVGSGASPGSPADDRRAGLLEIARIDVRLESAGIAEAEAERLRERRAELVARLSRED